MSGSLRNRITVRHALYTGSTLSLVATVAIWIGYRLPAASGQPLRLESAHFPKLLDGDSLATIADDVTANDPFRPDRAVQLAATTSLPQPAASSPAKPVPKFILRGIVGGPPWDAVIEGVPGHSAGLVIRNGERLGELSIAVSSRDSARVTWADSSWTLVLARR